MEELILVPWAVVLAIVIIWIAPDVYTWWRVRGKRKKGGKIAQCSDVSTLISICEHMYIRHNDTTKCMMIWGACDAGKVPLAVRCSREEAESVIAWYREEYPQYRYWITPIIQA